MSIFSRASKRTQPDDQSTPEPGSVEPEQVELTGYAASERPEPGADVLFETDADEADADEPVTHRAGATGAGRRRRPVLLGTAAGLALLLAGGGAVAASAHKTIDVDVDGELTSVTTFSGDVEGLLDELGVAPGEHDLVVPAPEEALLEGSDVVVRTAQQVAFEVDGEGRELWTTADTAGLAVVDVAGAGRDVSLVASRSGDGRVELELPLVVDGEAVIAADGTTVTVALEGEATLQDALAAAGIELGERDSVTVSAREDGTPLVTVVRRTIESTTTTEAIAHESEERETDDLYVGQSRVAQEGVDGVRTFTHTSRLVDGQVVATKVTSIEVTTEPVTHIVEVGTAERPAPRPAAPAPSSGSSDSGGSSGGSTVSGDVWAALAQCESGGNPTIVSSNGLYHGLYQFSVGTWRSVGGSGLPSEASPAEQTQRAQALQARSGWGQWPACSAKLGLR